MLTSIHYQEDGIPLQMKIKGRNHSSVRQNFKKINSKSGLRHQPTSINLLPSKSVSHVGAASVYFSIASPVAEA